MKKNIARRAFVIGMAGFGLAPALAWTDKPVRLLVPGPAGGTMDVLARVLADQLAADTGQPVLVDNKPGAGGAIAVRALMAAPPDGQTLMLTASTVLTEIPHVMKVGFDPLKDVKPVAALVRSNLMLIGATALPAKDFPALVAHVKANPGKMSFASYSAGSASHYAGMILNQKAGLDLQHVPFAGAAPALAQVMGGQVPLMFNSVETSLPLISAGKVKAYGVSGKSRSTRLPQVPTFTELGYPDLDFSNWLGIVASAGTPPELVDRLHAAMTKAAASPKMRERLLGLGFEPTDPVPAATLQQTVRADFERNAGIVKSFNIQLNQ